MSKMVDWYWSEELDDWIAEQVAKSATLNFTTMVNNTIIMQLPTLLSCPSQLKTTDCTKLHGPKEIKRSVRLSDETYKYLLSALSKLDASVSDVRYCVRMGAPFYAAQPSYKVTVELASFLPKTESDN